MSEDVRTEGGGGKERRSELDFRRPRDVPTTCSWPSRRLTGSLACKTGIKSSNFSNW